MTILWDVAPCSLAETDYRSDDGGNKYLWNVGQFLRDYTAQHPRRQRDRTQYYLCHIRATHSRIGLHTMPKVEAVMAYSGNCMSRFL
jgi:hypothetical protein